MCDARGMAKSPHGAEFLRVALDGTPLLGSRTGIGVAAYEMMAALARRGDLSVSAYATTLRRRDELRQHVPEGVGSSQRLMAARPLMAAWARTNHPAIERFVGSVDVVHGTNFVVPPARTAARVVSVWDLTFARFPELCEPATLRFEQLVRRALRTGAIVHTGSQTVAEEVREHFGARRDQVVAIHLGIPHLAEPDLEGARTIVPKGRPFILSIGTAEPRKDLPSLVAAFDLLAAEHSELELVLVGPSGWGQSALDDALAASPYGSRIRRPGFVTDEVLSGLLREARALAYPSLYEGFGFPPLQAMAVGTPVVTTRAGSLTEVVGGAALIVDPGAIEDLASALGVAVFDEAQRSVLIAAGRVRAADFSWDRMADELTELYRRLGSA